jgi:hypothetical protein
LNVSLNIAKKILIYVLIFVLAGPIFYAGNTSKTKAATTNQQSTGSNQTSATHQDPKPVTASCGNGCINSGYTVYLQCPTTVDINNATTTDSDHYQLTINWSVSFTPQDNEYINSAYIEWTGNPNDRQNLDVQKLSGTKTGTATKQLNLNQGYMPSVKVEVYNSSTGKSEGLIVSNICQFTKYSSQYQNGTGQQNSGGELGTGGAVNTGGSGDTCESKCKVGWLESHLTVSGAVHNAMCDAQCAIIGGIADILTWVINEVLLKALGVGGTSTSTSTPPAAATNDEVALAQKAFQDAKTKGVDMSTGPCLGEIKSDWVADVVHNPRQPIDDLPQNQCSQYNDGTVHHFVEVDTNGNFVREQ